MAKVVNLVHTHLLREETVNKLSAGFVRIIQRRSHEQYTYTSATKHKAQAKTETLVAIIKLALLF